MSEGFGAGTGGSDGTRVDAMVVSRHLGLILSQLGIVEKVFRDPDTMRHDKRWAPGELSYRE
jgi:hypothetical protein